MRRRSFLKGSLALGITTLVPVVARADTVEAAAARFIDAVRTRGGIVSLTARRKDGKTLLDFWHQAGRATSWDQWREIVAEGKRLGQWPGHRQAVVERLKAEIAADFEDGLRFEIF